MIKYECCRLNAELTPIREDYMTRLTNGTLQLRPPVEYATSFLTQVINAQIKVAMS